jgi:hypothetical protein
MTTAPHSAAGLRTTLLPIEHLDAELLAAPFASDSAFAGALVALDPSLKSATDSLWRQTERDLLYRFPGMSIDELIYRRDCAWFGPPGRLAPVPLGEMLRRSMREVIYADAGRARLIVKRDKNEAEQRHWWRWLTFSLPTDLLLAAAGAGSEQLDFVCARLRQQLELGGIAEPHLHLRAALDFPTLWGSLMRVLASFKEAKANMLASPGAEWDEGRKLAPLLLRCALARLLLAAYLQESRPSGFRDFLNDRAMPRLNNRFGACRCLPLWRSVYSLAAGQAEAADAFPVLRELYAQLIGPSQPGAELDPLAGWLPSLPEGRPDFWLTHAGLDYLAGRGANDWLFAQVFWQTVRGRVWFYRHVVQRPMVAGLQWFTRTYARLSKPRKAVPQAEFIRLAGKLAGPGLRALEVRVTPEDRLSDLLKLIGDLDKAAGKLGNSSVFTLPKNRFCDWLESIKNLCDTEQKVEMGVVFHFSRSRGPDAEKGKPSAWSRGGHDDPEATQRNPSGYRFSGYYREQRTGAMTLANALIAYPRLLERVRGVDLCTDELAVPLWVLLPLVRHVLRAADQATAYLLQRGYPTQRPLRVTVHGGEDFVHLLGGIRRVDEAIELLQLGEGSRIGHAVALGVDVRAWAARARRLVLPKGERLLDLLWAWRVARRVPEDLRSWLPWIEQELSRLSAYLFGGSPTVAVLEQWWECLHKNEGLRRAGFPDGPHPQTGGDSDRLAQDWVVRWLTDSALFRRAQELETIDADQEIPLVAALQAHVRTVIGLRGIAVEINPSSNLLIGHLGDLASHPLWRLCPPAGIVSDAPGVRVCIGSDDPITFATSLPEEYQLLADALNGAGIAGPDVDAWLEAARDCGLTTKFTVPRLPGQLDRPICLDMFPVRI